MSTMIIIGAAILIVITIVIAFFCWHKCKKPGKDKYLDKSVKEEKVVQPNMYEQRYDKHGVALDWKNSVQMNAV